MPDLTFADPILFCNGNDLGAENDVEAPEMKRAPLHREHLVSDSPNEDQIFPYNGNDSEPEDDVDAPDVEGVPHHPLRAPGRLKVIKTGKPGRPRKVYQCQGEQNDNPRNVSEVLEREDHEL